MSKYLWPWQRPFTPPTHLLLILFILVGFWLRLYAIDASGFWTDEGLTALRSGYPIQEILSNRIIIQEGVTNDTHPALFYIIIHFTRQLFGESDFAFRFLSTLAGILLIPLLYQFGRRLHSVQLGLLAALLTAVNPLQIWYANEARMYTLYVLLAAGASYVLWRALTVVRKPLTLNRHGHRTPDTGHRTPDYLVIYILLAGLALYTHYTAVFLIAAQSLFWGWVLWQQGYKKLILGAIGVGILIAIPLIPYTLPRLFQGTEANFYAVSPWVMLQDVVRFFGLGVTVDYQHPLIQSAAIGFGLLLLLGFAAPKRWLPRLFLAAYLFSVVLGLMAGSLIKPLYQGARHIMVSSPAYLLLISWGILTLSSFFQQQWHSKAKPAAYRILLTGLLAIIATAVPLTTAAIAINNQFNNPRYAKDAFRELIAFIEQTAGENDVIVYNNAILLALHDHYQQRRDIDVTASPIYPTNARKTAAVQLEMLAQTYDRLWFITDPPADNRDNNQIVQQWLDNNLAIIDSYPFHAATTALATIAYDTQSRYHTANRSGEMQRWPKLPSLVKTTFQFSQPVSTTAMWVDLFWFGERPPDGTALRFLLVDPAGDEWEVADLPLILQPDLTSPWTTEAVIRRSYPLPVPVGMPPGTYALLLRPFLSHTNITYDTVTLGDVDIDAKANAWAERPYKSPYPLNFTNDLSLQGIHFPDSEVRPGHAIPMTLYWQSQDSSLVVQDLTYTLTVVNENGDILREDKSTIGPDWLDKWPSDRLIRQNSGLYFPPDTEPGTYLLIWQIFAGETAVYGNPAWRPWTTSTVKFGEIQLVPWPLETSLPQDTTLTKTQFGSAIQLYSYDMTQTDTAINLTLYWQAQAMPDQNYNIFIHLVDQNGNIITQADAIPVAGLRPTGGWRPTELITDFHSLSLPSPLPTGTYNLLVGLYLPDTFVRPLVTVDGVPQPENQLLLTIITQP